MFCIIFVCVSSESVNISEYVNVSVLTTCVKRVKSQR